MVLLPCQISCSRATSMMWLSASRYMDSSLGSSTRGPLGVSAMIKSKVVIVSFEACSFFSSGFSLARSTVAALN